MLSIRKMVSGAEEYDRGVGASGREDYYPGPGVALDLTVARFGNARTAGSGRARGPPEGATDRERPPTARVSLDDRCGGPCDWVRRHVPGPRVGEPLWDSPAPTSRR